MGWGVSIVLVVDDVVYFLRLASQSVSMFWRREIVDGGTPERHSMSLRHDE
jgi:hypothetical protein